MIDYKKDKIYKQNQQVSYFEVPPYDAICIRGEGDPNEADFQHRVGALYSIAYKLKMAPKKDISIFNYEEYKVYPLEGIWDLQEIAKAKDSYTKSDFTYTIMIKQPAFITSSVFDDVIQFHSNKLDSFQKQVTFERFEEGKVVQILHIGSYDDEQKSFDVIIADLKLKNLERKTLTHREIYLSDSRKNKPENLKTILRFELKD
jgi:hypothetical protein